MATWLVHTGSHKSWKDDILITTISSNQGFTEEQSKKILYN